MATSWILIGGMAGYPSFATAAFFGVGAYAGALAQGMGAPLPEAWAAGGVASGVAAAAFGWIVLPLRGHYFAIASLAVVIVLRQLTLIRGVAAEGVTVLLVEHLMRVASGLCSRVVVLHHGRLIADPAVVEAYLGARYAERNRP